MTCGWVSNEDMNATEPNLDELFDLFPGLTGRVADVITNDRRRQLTTDEAIAIQPLVTDGHIRIFTAEYGNLWMERND